MLLFKICKKKKIINILQIFCLFSKHLISICLSLFIMFQFLRFNEFVLHVYVRFVKKKKKKIYIYIYYKYFVFLVSI